MWIYPGSDLHVVRVFADPLSFRVAVHDGFGRGGAWVDPSTVENMTVTFGEQEKNPATVHHAIASFIGSPHDPLDPLAPGAPRTVIRRRERGVRLVGGFVKYSGPGGANERGYIRVRVHG